MFNSEIPCHKKIKESLYIWHKRINRFIEKYFYDIFHAVVFFALTAYVITNWNECISMQFFSRFNGNNILFLVWIILILLIIYEVEGKGIKLRKRKQEQDQVEIDNANYLYELNSLSQEISDLQSVPKQGGEAKNEP